MDKFFQHTLPDLIINVCPLGCSARCARIWINESIGHRIICKCCQCGHNKKEMALELVGEPATNAIHEIPPSSKETSKEYDN